MRLIRVGLIAVVLASSASTARAATTAIALTASNTNPAAGANILLTATLSTTAATGTVTFLDGSAPLGSGTIASGVATFAVNGTTSGTHSYTASYSGDSTYAASTSFALTVTTLTAALNTNPAIPSNLQITPFATGLNYPYGMVQLPDGSLLVATSNPSTASFYGPTTLQIFRYTTTNGVADAPTLVLDDGLAGPATGMVGAGNIVAVATGANTGSEILILQAGAGGVLTQLGDITFSYPPGTWEHDSHTVALRAVPGQTGVYQLLISVGSQADSTATPLSVQVGTSGLISQNLYGDSLYSVQFSVTGTTVSAGAAIQLANGLRNPFALSFAADGDVYLVDNGQDVGLSNIATSADVFDIIPAGTTSILNFGFPNTFADPVTGIEMGSTVGITLPVVPFIPLSGGQNSQGAAGMTLSPTDFPATLSDGIFAGFFGAGFGYGSYWDPVIYYDLGTGQYFDFITGGQTGVGPILSMLSTDGALYLADLGSSNGGGVIYEVSVAQPSFSLSATAATATTGAMGPSTVSVTPAYGFNSGVTLAASNWPSGISATFGTNPATTSSLVTINVGPDVAPGPYSLKVNGTSGAVSASATIDLTVNAPVQPTTTTLAASDTAPMAETNITLTATTTPSAAAGVVTFYDGAVTLGTSTLSSGVATFPVNAIAVGPHSYTASYAGYASYVGYAASDSSTVAVTAQPVSTTTVLSASNAAPVIGSSIILTAAITPSTASGSVTFFDGVNAIGSGTLSGGDASLIVSAITAGNHSYTASYGGDSTYLTSISSAVLVTPLANSGQPSFTLSATSATANAVYPGTYIAYGDSITYGATASSTANQYTNLIATDLSAVLTNRGVGSTEACDTAQTILSNDNPPASLAPLQTIMIGTNDSFIKGPGAYEAVYKSCHTASLAWLAIPSSQKTAAQSCTQSGYWSADTTYQPGLAAISYSPGATLSCPVTSYGGPLYLWYRVTDSNPGAFTYSVDGGPSQPVNSFSSPTVATWVGGVNGVFVVRVPGLAAGPHTVVVTVTSAAVSILAVGSLNPVAQLGAPEVFAGGVIRNQYDYNSASTAAYDADAAADVALLSGDGLPVYFVPVRNFVNANGDMFDGFHPNDSGHLHLRDAFESLSQFPLNSPASFSSTVSVTPSGGFNSGVTLAASGWPTGITGTFGTNPATSSSTVTISVAASVAPGPYALTVTGTSGTLSASTTIPITVTALPGFTLSATAAVATAASPGTSTVTVTPTNGFHSIVEFSASNWPAGITATFGTNPTTASSTVTISVTAGVAPGLYALTLNGTLGTLSATTTIALTVTALQGLGSSANFTGPDTSTQGTWSPTYGADGYLIANGANNLPTYASVTVTGASTFTWASSTPDVGALQSSPGSPARIASCYYSTYSGSFNVNVNLTDGATHQVAIYLLDWDTTARAQTITITDSASGIILDSRSFSQFSDGAYGVWNIKGNVTINVTATGAGNAVVSGIFFGPVSAPPRFALSATAATANAGSTGTSTVTVTPANGFNSGVTLAASGWPTGITGTFGPNPATVSSTATISVDASVTPGPYTLTVNGTSGALSASGTIALTVNAPVQPTTTTLMASNTVPPAGTNITLTATAAPSAAAGAVTFYDGAVTLGSSALSGGVAIYTVSGISGGAHSYSASYGGNASYAASTSPAVAVTAQAAATMTSLSASSTVPVAGTSVTLTATSSSSAATGTVTFLDGAMTIGSGTLSGGIASYTISAIAFGPHSYTATYGGSANYATSTSPALSVTAQPVSTTTTLAASSTAPAVGGNVTLTATTSPSTATGSVTFLDGAMTIGTGTLSGGIATYAVSAIAAGTHNYTASYGGSSGYSPSISPAVTVMPLAASSTALSASSTNPMAGASEILTATTSPSAAAGAVTFLDGGMTIGGGTLSGGMATFTVSAIAAGTHSYTASYGGNSSYAASTSSAVAVTTQTAGTMTALSASNTTPIAGMNVTLTAMTSPSAATGTVSFFDGGVSIGTGTLSGGAATFTVSAIIVGPHSYTATYGGNSSYAASSSSAVAVTAQPAATTTTLTVSNATPTSGASVTLTAATSPSGVTGTVTFYDGGAQIGAGTLSGGAASFTVSAITVGLHSYTATYGGNASYATSTSPAVGVTASSGPYLATTFNEYSGDHALVGTAPASDGAGSIWSDPNGDWKYVSGGGVVSSGSDLVNAALIDLKQANYAATFTYPAAGAILLFRYVDANDYVYAETYPFGAIYLYSKVAGASTQIAILWTGTPAAPLTVTLDGSTATIASGGQTASATIPSSLLNGTQIGFFSPSADFTMSSLSVVLISEAAATTTTLSASNTTPIAGTNITLSAATSPSAATGTVTFLDNGVTIGSNTLSGGLASYMVTAIAGGPHSYTAMYGGNSSYAASSSSAVAVTAQPATTTTTLTTSNATPTVGTSVTLSATISPSAASGTVTFYDGGATIGSGTLSGGAASFTVGAISVGPHSYTAAYGGSASYAASTSSAVAVTGQPAASTTTLSVSNSAPAVGSSVTLTATVSASTATGTVTFLDGAMAIGTGTLSGGVASYIVSAISSGTHSYTASYGGSASYNASISSAVAVTTLAASTTTLTASSTTPTAETSITLTATTSPSAATGTVTFFDGVANLGPGTPSGGGVVTFTIGAIAGGAHSFTATYGGNATYAASTSSALAVTAQPAATTTTLSASNTTPIAGASVLLTATTAPSAATGTVTFLDGAMTIGSGTLSGGSASFAVAAIAGGAHSYTATYGGSANYATSTSSAVGVTAQPAPTTTTLSASNTAPAAGSSVTLTATTSASGATGTVSFLDGAMTIGTGTLSGGVATYTISSIAVGGHSYTAAYGGSVSFAASTSSAVAVTASSGSNINTSFNEYPAGHALSGTEPATDSAGSTWSDPNGDWTYASGGGTTAAHADLTNAALIDANQANYTATFTYPAAGAILLFRYVDANDYVYAETYSFGAIVLYSRVAGAISQIAFMWTGTPAAPLTVTLNGSTGTISCGGQTLSGTIPSSLLNGTQLGFYAPYSNFTISSLSVHP